MFHTGGVMKKFYAIICGDNGNRQETVEVADDKDIAFAAKAFVEMIEFNESVIAIIEVEDDE
jgi:hypothetical protein